MLPIDSKYSNRELNALVNIPVPSLLSLNDVFRESLRKAQEASSLQVIVRCEPLPQVQSTTAEMAALIDDLLHIIMKHPPTASKLFLYVDCEAEAGDMIDMTLPEGFNRYTIKFFTNISTAGDWELAYHQTLTDCRKVLSKHNGSFTVNDVGSTGCLFSMTLPGKIV